MAEAVFAVRRLLKSYGQGPTAVTVLKGLDLEVRAGQFLLILGPSGSGKSTLLNILGLMDEPTEGEVLLDGRPLKGLAEEEKARLRSRRLGFVFQFDALLPEFTMLENVTMPARIAGTDLAAAEARGRELLAGLGLAGLAHRFPVQASGGERQRVSLCRSLINRPGALLADEPTGNLDKENGELVFKDLRNLAETHGCAVVMVTHNEAAIPYANRILHMVDGRIEERVKP